MAHQHTQSITIGDERYLGRVSEVVATDRALTRLTKMTTLLLRGTDGGFVLHQHSFPAGLDQIHAIDDSTAQTLYRRMQLHLAPFEVFS